MVQRRGTILRGMMPLFSLMLGSYLRQGGYAAMTFHGAGEPRQDKGDMMP